MGDRIESVIARIIDAETLVLNVGWEAGVIEGMRFSVVQPADEIEDPGGGGSLGRWELVKAVVIITHVQERLATARPLAPGAVGAAVGDAPTVLSAQMIRDSMPRASSDLDRARVDPSQTSGRPRIEPIRVGDVARSIASRNP